MSMTNTVVSHTAYIVAVITVIIGSAWSTFDMWAKPRNAPMVLTRLHATIALVTSICVAILLLGIMFRFSK